jgi:hypothetical protein
MIPKTHVPRPGESGRMGLSECGRLATFPTPDHKWIRRDVRTGAWHYCADCRREMGLMRGSVRASK